jgi:hypothetical protein
MTWSSTLRIGDSTKHRVFVSYHHKDEVYRQRWDRLFSDFFVNVSVKPGEIDDSSSAEYIKRLIQKEYVTQASVVVVLVGPKAYCRKHIDWEISAGLNKKVGGYSGLLGIWLPNHPDSGAGKPWSRPSTPGRLADNLASGYAKSKDWSEDAASVKVWIEQAFTSRIADAEKIDNSRIQMSHNTCD